MKTFTIPILAGMLLGYVPTTAQKAEFNEHVSKMFTLPQNAAGHVLAIYNINGFVKVEGYTGNEIRIEVSKTITGRDEAGVTKGRQELQIGFDEQSDSLVVYVAAPFDSRPNKKVRDWTRHEPSFDFRLDFTIKVPQGISLHVATVNDGEVTIGNVDGRIEAANVNGGVTIASARKAASAHTINGDVIIDYLAVPSGASDFKTLNGDIRVTYPAGLSADCEFRSFNGGFYTDFPNVETLPARVIKNTESTPGKTTYKLSTDTLIRIGKGGQALRFETFNGDIYIKKQS
ncbi:DUF4097 family beta strand repeat-containing protein [Dyadobacter sandarakinus]|uniref:Adhesin domain-containing protein n=1 Tax=Dyadobacter sandarakinus TaxID=2747268 RepID=A0ABX7I489_9BACT|nr:hypothetical protein [Dyadobacter sandarakinus]QRR00382.1 hypothetical protein HWI92_05390 [Dyadobacter sandarakinus]